MLDYNILNKKPEITVVKDGELVTYKDLSAPIYKGNFIEGGQFVRIENYYVARPDLISLAVYGDDKYGDVICKINGLSNPFELNEGMYLYTPDIDTITKVLSGTKVDDDVLDEFKTLEFNKSQDQLSNKKSQSNYSSNYGIRRNETIDKKKKNLQKYRNERRTPGDQTVTDSNYIIDKSLGIVIY